MSFLSLLIIDLNYLIQKYKIMVSKKTKQADLESKRVGFIFLGLISASAFVLMAFSLSSVTISPISKIIVLEDDVKDDLIYDFFKDAPIPPPQKEQIIPPINTEVKVVDNDIPIVPPVFVDLELIDLGKSFKAKETVFKAKKIYEFTEVSPEFPGGEAEMAKFINETFVYPSISVEMGEQGIVHLEFVVNKDGSIEEVKVLAGVSDALDKEALRVVGQMPKWTPGENAGKPVNVRYIIPIKARLQ